MKLLSIPDASILLNVNVSEFVRYGMVPPPSHKPGQTHYCCYTVVEVEHMRRLLNLPNPATPYLSQQAMAERYGMGSKTLSQYIRAGNFPAPTRQATPKRKLWSIVDLPECDKAIDAIRHREHAASVLVQQRQALGLFSAVQAAKALNMPAITFAVWKREGFIFPPTVWHGMYRYYTREDLDRLRALVEERYRTVPPCRRLAGRRRVRR